MSPRTWDESDFTSRPSKHGSRPRTKIRPEHRSAERAMVVGVDRGRYTLLAGMGEGDYNESGERTLTAMRARELGRTRIVCGDRVDIVGDTSGDPGALARIVRVAERSTVLRRTADDTDPFERIVVANADQLVIVTALADPEPRPRMIDRCVVAAYDAGMTALLCLTKADLADPGPIEALYRPVGVDAVVTRQSPTAEIVPLDEVRARLAGKTSVLVGHSGVGKSTLVNALVPDAARAVGRVNDVTGRGRQTSTSAVALRLPLLPGATGDPGWVIDTPGIRSFGLAHVTTDRILAAFDDLAEVAQECPRGCTHLADAPDCMLDEWIAAAAEPDEVDGAATEGNAESARRAARVDSVRRLLTSR